MTEETKNYPESVSTDSVMVACPTYRGKAYALESYIRAYNDFTFPYRSLFMVDNTGTGLDYYEHLKSLKVPCDHINPETDWQKTFAMCWKRIWKEAVKRNVKWVASLEQDNIAPPLTIDVLLNVAGYCNAVHVAHSYPWHKTQSDMGMLIGLGCNLVNVELLTAIFAQDKWYTDAIESEIYEYPKINGMTSVEIHSLLKIKHLDCEDGSEFYHFTKEELPEFTKGFGEERKPTIYYKVAKV